MKIEEIDIDKLIPYEFNNKIHDVTQINRIANSIKEFGFLQPLVVDKDNIVIVGHGRLEGAKKLGLDKVPCVKAENLTEQQIKKYRILDNKLNESERNIENLKLELEDIEDLNIGDIELEIEDVFPDLADNEEENEVEEDEAPEVQEKAKMVRGGDLFQLGNHRLLCGDATKIEDIEELMNGKKADMVFTDPPYGVSYEGGLNEKKKQQIKNDNVVGENLYHFLFDTFTNIKMMTKIKSGIYIFYATKTTKEFINAFIDSGLKQRGIIARYKQGGGFGDFMSQYMNAYEPCIYGSNGETVNRYGPSNEKTVWEISKEKKCDLHPTMKPIELVARAIKNSSKINDEILDTFGGSGSTLIACEQLGRKCYMMELDPKYIEVIIKRFHKLNPSAEIKCVNRDIDLTPILAD